MEDLLNALHNSPIMIYGAHLVAVELYRYIRRICENAAFAGFVVTAAKGNPTQIEGEPVMEIQNCQADRNTTVLIAMPEKYHKEAEEHAREFGYRFFIKFSLEKMSELKGKQLLCDYKSYKDLDFYLYEDAYDTSWLNMGERLENLETKEALAARHYKFPTLYYLNTENIFCEAKKFDFYREYEQTFGNYHNLHAFPVKTRSKGDRGCARELMHIYMVFSRWDSAKLMEREFPSWIYPLQAGSVLTEHKANTCLVETGDSISDKNSVLAEMTAAYWIWKNTKAGKYKGLCHYRRHFLIEEEDILNLEKNNIDVILTTPRYAPGGVKRMFLSETPVKEPVYQMMLDAVTECHPDDRNSFEKYMESCLYCPNNMVIAKSEIYDAYCAWLFPVLFRMMEMDKEYGYGHQNDRHIAYAAELLTSYFFARHKDAYCVAVTDYRFYA